MADSLLEMRSDFAEEEPVPKNQQFSEIKEEPNLNNSSIMQRSADSRDEIGGFLTEREHNNSPPTISKTLIDSEVKTPPKPLPIQIMEELPAAEDQSEDILETSDVQHTDVTNDEIKAKQVVIYSERPITVPQHHFTKLKQDVPRQVQPKYEMTINIKASSTDIKRDLIDNRESMDNFALSSESDEEIPPEK